MPSDSEADQFTAIMARSAALKLQLGRSLRASILATVDLCEASLRQGGKLLFCGNGGSAADSQHLATELLIRLRAHVAREAWPALALTLDPAMLTACGNDFGFDQVFARPLRGLGRAGDVLFAITTSGRSANVIEALRTARDMGIASVGLLGGDGEPARSLCRIALHVPDHETARIQECHITLGHAVLELLENRLIAEPIVPRPPA